MEITKICVICGKEFRVPHWRDKTAKYCSTKCQRESLRGELNCKCPICGKKFHLKAFAFKKYNKTEKCCSRECLRKYKSILMSGEGNHQYGLKGKLNSSYKGEIIYAKNHNLIEIMVFSPKHPYCDKNGRVKQHRLIVEENYARFNKDYFIEIEGNYYLKRHISVHHIDGNHLNNNIENLIPCTRKEHKQYHKSIITKRDNLGRIVECITAVSKQGELLENLEVDNQQPSISLTTDEGSETNSIIL